MKPIFLKTEFLDRPLGLASKTPRLSWRLEDPRIGACQKAYRIVASSSAEKLAAGVYDLWDTGRVSGASTLDIPYAGKALKSRSAVHWRVQSWDLENRVSDWSEPALFEIGLFGKGDVTAKWIGPKEDRRQGGKPTKPSEGGVPHIKGANMDTAPERGTASPMLRKAFRLTKPVRKARLHASALGSMELFVNGAAASADVMAPGWTDTHKRIELVTYDVTPLLREGENVVAAQLGDGWYAGYLAWGGSRCFGGDHIGLLAQLEIEFTDGTRQTVATDTSWKLSLEGPVRFSDHYNGETYDARREANGWTAPGFDDSAWEKPKVLPAPAAPFVPRPNAGIVRANVLPARKRTSPAKGVYIFDLGQNMVGHEHLVLRGRKGGSVKIRFAEMLNPDGTMYTANYRCARSTDHYTFRSAKPESYEPHFTFHGFRYIEVSGDLAEAPACADVHGIVLHTDMEKTGSFECSDALANRLYSNLNWGQIGNYLDVPTDCPQRDERLGWTGDAEIFVRTAAFNRDVAAFFTKWCLDLDDAQTPEGRYPDVAPDILNQGGNCGWGDAGVICPWTMYEMYGDLEILRTHFDAMAKWVDWWTSQTVKSGVVTWNRWHYGDWVSVDCPIEESGVIRCGDAPTPSDLISTAYYARSAELVAKAAKLLGKKAEERKYAALRKKIEKDFRAEYVSPNGRIAGDTQTGYLLALGFDLVRDPKQVDMMVRRLVRLIEARGNTLSTGFIGTPLLCPVLTRFGRADVAYRLFHQTVYPSWNYPILEGDATTMWERWNSYTKKRGFGDVGMNSFNHYAYGAIGEWMYQSVIGIAPAAPGFSKIRLAPVPGGNLDWAKGSVLTRHGKAELEWKKTKGGLSVHFVVPPNTTAVLALPGRDEVSFVAGTYDVKIKD